MAFKRNYIYEVIIEIDTGVKKNFAPMGIKYLGTKDGTKKFEIDVFKGTNTACLLTENLNKNFGKRNFTVTCIFTSDTNYFYACITKNFFGEFIRKIKKFPKIVFEIEKIDDLGKKLGVICLAEIKKDAERKIEKNLLNRAKYLALEVLICYTKPISYDEKKEKISEMLRVIKKVAPDSDYERFVSDLLNFYSNKGLKL
ncbi:MAG: DUF447 family protein [Candidatus Altarchaeum sp.]|nr:DUF447 family protein [Candidatus Altarchaeum sp.]